MSSATLVYCIVCFVTCGYSVFLLTSVETFSLTSSNKCSAPQLVRARHRQMWSWVQGLTGLLHNETHHGVTSAIRVTDLHGTPASVSTAAYYSQCSVGATVHATFGCFHPYPSALLPLLVLGRLVRCSYWTSMAGPTSSVRPSVRRANFSEAVFSRLTFVFARY